MTAPVPVLLARLEHVLEDVRLAVRNSNYVRARDHVERAQELAKQVREAL